MEWETLHFLCNAKGGFLSSTSTEQVYVIPMHATLFSLATDTLHLPTQVPPHSPQFNRSRIISTPR